MREIKFKARSIKNGEWVKGYYAKLGKGENIKHYIIENREFLGFSKDNMFFNDVEIDSNTLCQYTELKDKYKKEIYENDRIHYYYEDLDEDCYGTVIWEERIGMFLIKFDDGCCDDFDHVYARDIEVIGNKFE